MHFFLDTTFIMVYYVDTMFVDDSTYIINGKSYRRILLRNSYRVKGKVQHDTIANLSRASDEEIEAIKLALRHKSNLKVLGDVTDQIKTQQGLSVGAVWLLYQLAKRIGLTYALGNSRSAKLGLWMVMATVIAQGSRLSAVRLAGQHAVCDILRLDSFNEDDLYDAMDWLALNQAKIEQKLFKYRYGSDNKPKPYLYDVTSSYLEGEQNELSEYGYNRDGKRGKKQIVIGLMTDDGGWPICVQVFQGNTTDQKTVKDQIEKMAGRFKVKDVTLVGDRGMISSVQVKDLAEEHFHYITAITKPQIETLLKRGIIQLGLFEEKVMEIEDNAIRYILRRNPARVVEIAMTRENKLERLNSYVAEQNVYLKEHARAKVEVAIGRVRGKIDRLKINKWAKVEASGRRLGVEIDQAQKAQEARLDGCYCVKTDLPKDAAGADTVHARYKDLSQVEWAFRTMKTTFLEMRGIFVRKEARTKAHVFIIMLAYLIAYQLRRLWNEVEATLEEGITELSSICGIKLEVAGSVSSQTIPQPRKLGKLLLEKANITLPDALPCRNVEVVTRKKLVAGRKRKLFQWDKK